MSRRALSLLPTLSPAALAGRAEKPLPFPLADPNLALFAWGRQALYQGMLGLGLGDGDEVLTPAYHHGSEVGAILRTGAGIRFYGGNDLLEPDKAELEELLGPRVRALHLTHYIGFPQRAEHWRRWCSERGLMLIEDAAQSWLATDGARPVGSFGDLAVFCLYKAVAVPDGGALVCRAAPGADRSGRALGIGGALRRAGLWGAQRSALLARLSTRNWQDDDFDPEREFALGEPRSGPSRATELLLPRLGRESAPRRRRHNYARLLAGFPELVPAPFDRLPAGASPWFFPVRHRSQAGAALPPAGGRHRRPRFLVGPPPSAERGRLPRHRPTSRDDGRRPVHQSLSDRDVDEIAAVLGRLGRG